MYILTLETTGKYGSAAVISGDGRIYEAASDNEMNHLRDIMVLTEEAMSRAGISRKDLTHAAASIGPGSFTGIRIGVTTARTIGQVLGIPCVGVSSLRAMADRVSEAAAGAGAAVVVPVINARRHQTYAGAWELRHDGEDRGLTLSPALGEKQYMIEDLLAEVLTLAKGKEHPAVFITGDGIDAYREIIEQTLPEGMYLLADESIRYQDAASVARVALEKASRGEILGYEELLPEYMRLAEAEQRLREGTLSDKIKKAGGHI